MEIKNDLRIIRTYKSLTEAFLQLMSEKHFEEITIMELCEKALIRRTTFYKHFSDKYDFFRFFVIQLQADFDASSTATADYQNPQSFFISIIHHVLNFFRENEQLVKKVLDSNLFPALLEILSNQITFDITQKIKVGIKKGMDIPANPEIVASFFTGAIIQTTRWWLMQKKQLPEEKFIEEMEKIFFICLNGTKN